MINLLQQFETFTYTPDEARYPYQLPDLRLPQAPPEQNNCCTFVEADRVLTLESNSAYRHNGVGFRAMGNLRDTGGKPPENWWQNDALWTWEKIQATYQYRQQARVKVKSRSWSGLT